MKLCACTLGALEGGLDLVLYSLGQMQCRWLSDSLLLCTSVLLRFLRRRDKRMPSTCRNFVLFQLTSSKRHDVQTCFKPLMFATLEAVLSIDADGQSASVKARDDLRDLHGRVCVVLNVGFEMEENESPPKNVNEIVDWGGTNVLA